MNGRAGLLALACVVVACNASAPRPATPAHPPASTSAREVWIRDVTVVSMERAAPLAHANVLLRDDRIAWVDTKPPPSVAPDATIIEGAGRFLAPGLIDGHVHLAEVPGVPREQYASMPAAIERYFAQLPRSYLYFGFTTVVDLNVVEPERLASIRAAPIGPKVLDCGGAITIANGYPMAYVPSPLRFRVFPNFLYDARQASAIPPDFAPADHTPAAAVARAAAGGAVCVKAFFEPGFGEQRGKLPTPTVDVYRDVAAEAHRRKLPLLLHANSLSAHRFAVSVGADVAVHGLWEWEEKDEATVHAEIDDEIRAGIGLMATSRVISGLEDLFAPEFLDDPHLARVLPAALIAWYRSDAGKWFAQNLARGFDGAPADRIRQVYRRIGDAGRAAARYFADHAGRLYFGSDTPSGPVYANPPGYNGYLELRELERAGIAPRAVLTAATIANARLFGVSEDVGTIEPGKRANLVLLGANPLDSLAAFDSIAFVIVDGRVVARAELTAP